MLFKKRKKRIFVVDDDGDFRRVTEAILEHAGYAVDMAEDGEEARKALKKKKYDLMIFDVVMPKIGGIKLFQIVRKTKGLSTIPVILISGHTNKGGLSEQEREIVDRADGFLQKPIKTKTLLDMAKALVEK